MLPQKLFQRTCFLQKWGIEKFLFRVFGEAVNPYGDEILNLFQLLTSHVVTRDDSQSLSGPFCKMNLMLQREGNAIDFVKCVGKMSNIYPLPAVKRANMSGNKSRRDFFRNLPVSRKQGKG